MATACAGVDMSRLNSLLNRTENGVQIIAGLCTIFAFGLAVYAFVTPASVSEYLQEVAKRIDDTTTNISQDTSNISDDTSELVQQIPYWTKLSWGHVSELTFEMRIENPSNYLIRDYEVYISFDESDDFTGFDKVALPPRENFTVADKYSGFKFANMCIRGGSTKTQKTVYEWRRLSFSSSQRESESYRPMITVDWGIAFDAPMATCENAFN